MASLRMHDPQWHTVPPRCPACGYALTGLSAPGRCPECGFEWGEVTLVLSGVAYTASGTPMWRKALMVLLLIIAIVVSTCWQAVFFIPIPGYVSVIVVAGSLGLFVFFVATGKRQRRGIETFVFANKGFAQCAGLEGEDVDSLTYDWQQVNHLDFKRVSHVWYRLRLGYRQLVHKRVSNTIVLDVGVRCPDDEAQKVRKYLVECFSGSAGDLPVLFSRE